jgi:hypothetical protein
MFRLVRDVTNWSDYVVRTELLVTADGCGHQWPAADVLCITDIRSVKWELRIIFQSWRFVVGSRHPTKPHPCGRAQLQAGNVCPWTLSDESSLTRAWFAKSSHLELSSISLEFLAFINNSSFPSCRHEKLP